MIPDPSQTLSLKMRRRRSSDAGGEKGAVWIQKAFCLLVSPTASSIFATGGGSVDESFHDDVVVVTVAVF